MAMKRTKPRRHFRYIASDNVLYHS